MNLEFVYIKTTPEGWFHGITKRFVSAEFRTQYPGQEKSY